MRQTVLGTLLCVVCLSSPIFVRADELERGFAAPPDVARPHTWWHWISGNVSKDGMTADLESMKRIGLGGAQMFSAKQGPLDGPLVYMSPEWPALVKHSIAEANRLGLELAIHDCEGWTESGGPWITPELSMQKVVWTEQHVRGPAKFNDTLKQPETVKDFYRDIAVLAFPSLGGEETNLAERKPKITTSAGKPIEWATLTDGNPRTTVSVSPGKDEVAFIQFEFEQPVRCASFAMAPLRQRTTGEFQASDDGKTFRTLATFSTQNKERERSTSTFDATSARWFRIYSPKHENERPLVIGEVEFGSARVSDWRAKTATEVRIIPPRSSADVSSDMIVQADKLIDLTAKIDSAGRLNWDAPDGDWTILRIGHTSTGKMNHPAMDQTRGLECDKFSRAAVEAHFNGMLVKVIGDSQDLIGKGLNYVLMDSWEAGCQNWTPAFRAEFQKRRGYDPLPWLVALSGRYVDSPEKTERFLWDFRRMISDLVAENHYGFMRSLLQIHGLKLTAEAVGRGLPTVADQLQCKGRTDMPMAEFWIDSHADELDTREAASAAHIYGKPIASAEAFTAQPIVAGWKKDPFSMKALGDFQFCNGINRFVFHRYAHQPWPGRWPGITMGRWGTNFERTNTWWEQASAWMTYLSRCQYMLQRGLFVADACYYYGEDTPRELNRNVLKPPPPAGFDYDACNAEVLLTRIQARDGRILLPDGMSYGALVLPETDLMTPAVARKVKELVGAGAIVIGPRPMRSPSLADFPKCDDEVQQIGKQVWGDCDGKSVTEHPFGKGTVMWGKTIEEALSPLGPDFGAKGENPSAKFCYIHRRDGDAEIYFVSSQSERAESAQCTFRVNDKVPQLWRADTGEIENIATYTAKDGRTTIPIRFDPAGSVFVVFRPAAGSFDPIASVKRDGKDAGPVEVFSTDGHVALLAWQGGEYELTTAGGKSFNMHVAPIPSPIDVAGPWELYFPAKWGTPDSITLETLTSWTKVADAGVKHFSGTAIYVKEFDLSEEAFAKDRRQYLDLGQVKNLAEVKVNGTSFGVLWKPPFRVNITSAAKPGRNRLEIKVTNLWPNRLIGDLSLPEDKRFTWTTYQPFTKDSPLLESGLLGPVRVISAAVVRTNSE